MMMLILIGLLYTTVVCEAIDTCESSDCGLGVPHFPPNVGTKKLFEDDRQVVWDLTIEPGVRCPPHEHIYNYSFHVLQPSRLAVYSGEDGSHVFEFDTIEGETKAFRRIGTQMVDIKGILQSFDAVHGVENVGSTTYREILVESKPCDEPTDFSTVRRISLYAAASTDIDLGGMAKPQNVSGVEMAIGVRANHESEVEFANGVTHVLLTSPTQNLADEHVTQHVSRTEAQLSCKADVVFDYRPIVAHSLSMIETRDLLMHLLLVKFKVNAPVGDLVQQYSELPNTIHEMKAFEWGPVANGIGHEGLADGYEYAFITTFFKSEDRDAYLTHDAHSAYAAILFPHIDKVVVLDFWLSHGVTAGD